MARRGLSKTFGTAFGTRKSAAKKKMISAFSGVDVNAPKLNKATSRQRKIKDTLDWW